MTNRLPSPGSDDNTWGDILNAFLGVAHNADGTLQTGSVGSAQITDGSIVSGDISATAGITKTQLASAVQTSLSSADSALQSVPSATSSVLGAIQLAGDLGGTATAPTTPTAVHLTGTETISGAKTFSVSPTVPTPTNGTDAATKAYVDSPQYASTTTPVGGTADTNYYTIVDTTISNRTIGANPIGSTAYHDLLAFNRWWGAPTFKTSTDGTTYTTGTLDSNVFAQKDYSYTTIIDGTTNIGAQWIWNNTNVNSASARSWMISFPYQATPPSRTIVLDSSTDGSTWTNRFTASGINTQTSQFYFTATTWSADTYLRLTITVSGGSALLIQSIRAFSPRSGNQGGGRELALPYAWDSGGRITLNPASSTGTGSIASYSNGLLNIGGANPTTSINGIYFGTDTNLYRSGTAVLQTDAKFYANGGLQLSSGSIVGQVWTATDTNGNGTWQTAGSGYGRSFTQMSSSITAGNTAYTDYIYYWSGAAFTLTLPTAVSNTNRYTLKNASAVSQTVTPQPSQSIDGATAGASITILANNSVDLISNGSNWLVI